MANTDRIYFARRAAEEQERATAASDPDAADAARILLESIDRAKGKVAATA